jgi:hypothetical protein
MTYDQLSVLFIAIVMDPDRRVKCPLALDWDAVQDPVV